MAAETSGRGFEAASASGDDGGFSLDELQVAARNHAVPLEALRYAITPTGLHYLLTHFDIPHVDPHGWRLAVRGRVERPLSLTLPDIESRPRVTLPVTLECAGNGRAFVSPRPGRIQPWLHEAVGTGEWTGTPLKPLLEEAGLLDDVVEILFSGVDRGIQGGVEHAFERSLPVGEALRDEVLLAYRLNGQPLPPQHGFPLRLVVPGWYGMASVKWLAAVTALAQPFEGYQQARTYRFMRFEGDPGTPVTRMFPRALTIPPGIPQSETRARFLTAGRHVVQGRAWSGWAPIARVEVSVDGARTWSAAELGQPPSAFAWHPWSWTWDATEPGTYELCARATDAAGNVQPSAPRWNLRGFGNNMVQRVRVVVTEPRSA
jgi:sulfane dehydrogenase subunit SoxC